MDRISCTRQKRISARRLDQAEFFNAIRKYRPFVENLPNGSIRTHAFKMGAMNARKRRESDRWRYGQGAPLSLFATQAHEHQSGSVLPALATFF
jgi:hypothetical protein